MIDLTIDVEVSEKVQLYVVATSLSAKDCDKFEITLEDVAEYAPQGRVVKKKDVLTSGVYYSEEDKGGFQILTAIEYNLSDIIPTLDKVTLGKFLNGQYRISVLSNETHLSVKATLGIVEKSAAKVKESEQYARLLPILKAQGMEEREAYIAATQVITGK